MNARFLHIVFIAVLAITVTFNRASAQSKLIIDTGQLSGNLHMSWVGQNQFVRELADPDDSKPSQSGADVPRIDAKEPQGWVGQQEPLDWAKELRLRVIAAQRLVRKGPDDSDSRLEESQHLASYRLKISNKIADLPGKPVFARFVVSTVLERNPPRPPNPPGASDIAKQLHEKAMAKYERDVKEYEQNSICVVGTMTWQQPVARMPGLLREKLRSADREERHRLLDRWKGQIPEHTVAFYAPRDVVERWRAKQVRSVQGMVQVAGIFWEKPRAYALSRADRRTTYVKIDLFLKDVTFDKNAKLSEVGTSADGSNNDGIDPKAKQILDLAEMFRSAGKKDLAAKHYRQVIGDFEGTPAAASAEKRLESLTK